ncbi:MAG: acyl-CoA dehydrogenase [archaeon]|nr:acyl-CoA dehydrogenase [archaeon]
MDLLNPKNPKYSELDEKSREIMLKTIEFFEKKGLEKILEDDHSNVWYEDFIEFQKKEKIFSSLLTPSENALEGNKDARWDTNRNCYFNEILGFYGLPYWYTWQVSILGLGPIWISKNDNMKKRASQALIDGGVFAFGLSEQKHGADLYSSEMKLIPQEDGTYRANGEKYYIGNGQTAAFTSTFGKIADKDGKILSYPESRKDKSSYVFFGANFEMEGYECIKNVCQSQNYVANYALNDYQITENEILAKGQDAWDMSLNTINVGKYNLGWASIGIATHAFFESLDHASDRILFNHPVTDFTHIQQFFVESYCRLIAMKLFALRTKDYLRTASSDDRRYLLYNPMVKMKVTTEGEKVVRLLSDIIAAKGFEKDTYFQTAARNIGSLPKLEGTVHVNMALIVKFMPKFFGIEAGPIGGPHVDYPEVPKVIDDRNDSFLFNQGAAKALTGISFHDYHIAYNQFDLPNVKIFQEQIEIFREMCIKATPTPKQGNDIDFVLLNGELFTLCAYGQLILENAKIYGMDDDLIEQIFDFMIRDFSMFALKLYSKPITKKNQMEFCMNMIKKPVKDNKRFDRVREKVYVHKGVYQ